MSNSELNDNATPAMLLAVLTGGFCDINDVAKDPSAFTLVLSGHNDHPDCNGRYKYDGRENGKPKFAKTPGTMPKVFWTGHSWDCFWSGCSPEAPHDTPVPPLDGYTSDQGGCDIKVMYESKSEMKWTKPGPRLTHADSEAHAGAMGGRLLTLDEARALIRERGGALYAGEDQWAAVQGRDWVQVGDMHHHAGKSHVQDCGGYPPWGDDADNATYGNATWNYVALWTGGKVLTKDAALKAAVASSETLLLALAPATATTALMLLEHGADASSVRGGLLADGATRLRALVLDPSADAVAVVRALAAKDTALKAAVTAPANLLATLAPATVQNALALFDLGASLDSAAPPKWWCCGTRPTPPPATCEALLSNDAKQLRALVFAPGAAALVDALCDRDAALRAAIASPETLIAALQLATADAALRLLGAPFNVPLTDDVRTALTAGDAAITPTSALKLARDVYLEDDGADLPLGNCAYTVEMWICFDGQHSCFFGWGHEPNNGCIGAHFEGGFNHFWSVLN